MNIKNLSLFSLFSLLIILYSCAGGGGGRYGDTNTSQGTGWKYNDSDWGGFEVIDYYGQETSPGLVLIEGGTFAMGAVEQDVTYEWHNIPRRVTVASFYLDETEVSNVLWREYVYWTGRVFGADFPEIVWSTLPDTNCWRDPLAYNEPYVEYYFRHPAYNFYPVVGINWLQATEFCKWRTDRVNELLLIREGYLEVNPNQVNEDNFNTKAYLAGQYEGIVGKYREDLNPNGTGERRIRFEDGILQPDYRLPTEAEWEFAALAYIGNNPFRGEELISDRRLYPWDGHSLRNPVHGGWQGEFLTNFKRGRGDNMGVAGGLNDNADITAPIDAFIPNDYGLYNMAGNVSEWVMDVYRPMSLQDNSDFNSYRGNVFKKLKLDEDEGIPMEKDSLGRLRYEEVTEEENVNRRNYRRSEYRDYLDGDKSSEVVYDYGVSSLINNNVRVYKGGSWNDRAYFMTPGARRFQDESQSSFSIGFRCAMMRVGPANDQPAGKYFSK